MTDPTLFANTAADSPSLPGRRDPGPAAVPVPGEITGGGAPGLVHPAATPDEARAAVDWLRWGRHRGLAAEALLFAALAGTPPRKGDFNGHTAPGCRTQLYRCLRLVHDLPWARRGLDVLAAAGPVWRALARHWDELTEAMAAEIGPTWPEVDRARNAGHWPITPRTDALLRQLLRAGGAST